MDRIIKSMEEKYLVPALELVEAVFTAPECLMVKALVPGALAHIHGTVSYHDYDALR
ncbi:MAG: hypothetical protein IKA16_01185 [Oscillospiraceae bacterium]|nr:hypothetical protein [Oscillospiraceae bacterium]